MIPPMSDQDGTSARAAPMPPWLDEAVLHAMDAALRRQGAWRRNERSARKALRDLLLALRPALPFAMLDEGVALLLPDAGAVHHPLSRRPQSGPAPLQSPNGLMAGEGGTGGRTRPRGHATLDTPRS